jgi:hypothetical protein
LWMIPFYYQRQRERGWGGVIYHIKTVGLANSWILERGAY